MTPQEFLRDFGHFIDAPNGIQKLRELILQLAVQGKLVEQDEGEESAHVLLEIISSKKSELIKAQAIKKEKKLQTPDKDEIPFQIPGSWAWTRLGYVTNYGSTDKAEANDVGDDTWVLELEDVEKITSRLLKRTTFEVRQFKSSKNRFKMGDVIYGKLRPYLDKVLVADQEGVCTTEMIPIRGYHGIKPDYLRWYLKSPYFIQYADSSTHGMNLPRMGTDKGRMALFPLPPLPEQHRIVAKVDELMALCDQLETEHNARQATHQRLIRAVHHPLIETADAKATQTAWHRIRNNFADLYTTLESVQALRQTILQLGVQGRLVEQDKNDEPASTLIEEIKADKETLIADKVFKKSKALPTIEPDEVPFDAPPNWAWERLGNVVYQVTDGAHHTPTYVPSGIPFLSVKDMSSGYLSFSNTRYISEEQHVELSKRCKPEKGDILLTKVGTTGIPVIVNTDIEFSIFVSVALIKFHQHKLSGDYLKLLINSPTVKKQSEEGTEGVGNKNLVLRKINAFVIAIPPLAEQHRIVAKVDELMALCDQLEANIRDKNTIATRYAEAIVQQIAAA